MQVNIASASLFQVSSAKAFHITAAAAHAASGVVSERSQSAFVSISTYAKAASDVLTKLGVQTNGNAFSQEFFDKINALQGQDKIDAYAQAAALVSAQQGLPPGQFDFTHMTKGQATIAATYLKNKGDPEAAGILTALNQQTGANADFSTRTFNVSDMVKSAAAADPAHKSGYDAALSFIDKFDTMVKGDGKTDPSDTTVYDVAYTDTNGNAAINHKGHINW